MVSIAKLTLINDTIMIYLTVISINNKFTGYRDISSIDNIVVAVG